jgi:tRNA-specific 2-thiouridylase
MTNWDDDDGYCDAASDLQDARQVCARLGLTLHRVNFADEYRHAVFDEFLRETRAGRTPNPDVLCNRTIKFGILRRYAQRLGGEKLATGHYAQLTRLNGETVLLRGADAGKDQSYFLSAVHSSDLADIEFPIGGLTKPEVRRLAADAGLAVAGKRDSTGICFIGERPFADFLGRFIAPTPGDIVTESGQVVGRHEGLHRYTLGQRKGIGIGGIGHLDEAPWYVAAKRPQRNELVVVQGHDHPALLSDWLDARQLHWIGPPPDEWQAGDPLRCQVKTRYRQSDQPATLYRGSDDAVRVVFDEPQRAVTPGQQAVFYMGPRCLGGAVIAEAGRHGSGRLDAAEAV